MVRRTAFSAFLAIALLSVAPLSGDAGAFGTLLPPRMGLFHTKISPDGNRVLFTWQGDIWVAEIETGSARRVTDNTAYDHHAVWFPDGNRIAFSSNRDGNDDIYSMPLSGGEPVRHTWYPGGDICLGVSPDGNRILFRSARTVYGLDLWEVDVNGGMAKPVTRDTSLNLEACYSPDGSTIAVCRGAQTWVRRSYHGSADSDIYAMNRDGSNMRWVENAYDGLDYWPVFSPDGQYIYFVSDRESGNENVWRIPAEGGPAERITSFADRPVHWLSISDTGRLCFTQDFRLWIKDPGHDPVPVTLDIGTDPKHMQAERLDISGQISEMEISPLGTYAAVIARGDLFMAPLNPPDARAPLGDVRFGESIRITETPFRECHVAWHPDGDKVVLVSDRDGNNELYEIDLRTMQWSRLTHTAEEEYFPTYSPDGKMLAYYHGNDELRVRNLETGADRVVVRDLLVDFPGMSNYGWSPDSRWIAYTGNDCAEVGEVFVVGVADGLPDRPVNITVHHDYDGFQGWSKDGKDLYFLSMRTVSYGLNGYASWEWGASLFDVQLQYSPVPLSGTLNLPEKSSQEPAGEPQTIIGEEQPTEPETSGDETEGGNLVEIDFDRIEERARLVTPTRCGGWVAALSPDCRTFIYDSSALGTPALWSVPFEGGSATMIASTPSGVQDIEWLPDGSAALYLSGGRIYRWNKGSSSVTAVPTYGRLTVDRQAERKQMVLEAGRVLRHYYYDPGLHGVHNWEDIVNIYAPLAEQATTPEEFELLLEMMFGELKSSHMGSYGGSSFEGTGFNPGMLGIDFDPFTTGPGLRVTEVWPRGPADYEETRIEVGEWVLKINGTEVSNAFDYWKLLDDLGNRPTVLTVAEDQQGTNSREVTLAPLPYSGQNPMRVGWYDAIYQAWADRNRDTVRQLSGGRVGYIHIPRMRGGPLEEFARELFSENNDVDALIIDVRFNSGGNIHEALFDILSEQRFGYARDRDGTLLPQPSRTWDDRPIVLLINERSFSDSEIFPAGFRALGLGTLMGVATSGGVIGTVEYQLLDGTTYMRIPRVGWYTRQLEDLENLGIQPDILVEQDLNHIRDGIDDQLNAAVEFLLRQIRRP